MLPDINFNGHCLINDNVSLPKRIVNLYISYTLNQWPRDSNTDFTLGSCFFGSAKLTNIVNLGKYKYSSYGIGLAIEAKCPINFTQRRKRFASSLHYNGSKSFLFVNATKISQFKAKVKH